MLRDELFQPVSNIEEVTAVGIFDITGLMVDGVAADDDMDMENVAAEFAGILSKSHKTGDLLGCGKLEEVNIIYKDSVVAVKDIKEGYFIGIAVKDISAYGKIRLELKKTVRKLGELI